MSATDARTTTSDAVSQLNGCAESRQSQSGWRQVGRYAMRLEPWTVAKYSVCGVWRYALWMDGEKAPRCVHDSFTDARDAALAAA